MGLTIWEKYILSTKDADELFSEIIQKCKELELYLIISILNYMVTEGMEKTYILKYFDAICRGEFWLLEERYHYDEIYSLMLEDRLNCLYKMQKIKEEKGDSSFYSTNFYEDITKCVFSRNDVQNTHSLMISLVYLERIGSFIFSLK